MRRSIYTLIILASAVWPFLSTPSAYALSVTPIRFEYTADPGDTLTDSVRLTNDTTIKQTYYPVVQDFTASSDESGKPLFLPEGTQTSTSIITWVTFETTSTALNPGETRYVPFHIHVPKTAEPGGYYGGLLFSTAAPSATNAVGVAAKVGPLVLIKVTGDAKELGSILSFTATPSTVSHLPVDFSIRFQNTGTVHLQPTGEIRITNMLGGGVATIPVNPEADNVLPNSVRRFESSWQRGATDPDAFELPSEWENFGFGLYTASLVLQYGTAQSTAVATTTFWVIPWQLLVLVVIVVALFLLLLRTYTRARARRKRLKQ